MSAAETVRALAAGLATGTGSLLHNVRVASGGDELYGAEAATQLMRTHPLDLEAATCVATPAHVALIGERQAIVADVYGEHVARVWRLAPAPVLTPEPRIDVPFHPDLSQTGGDVFGRGDDFPDFAGDWGVVEAAGRALIEGWSHGGRPTPRARAFVVRAFGDASAAAVLFAVHAVAAGQRRDGGFIWAVALLGGDGARMVVDEAGRAAAAAHRWSPRA